MVVDPRDTGLLGASPSRNNLCNVLLTLVASVFEYLVVRLFVAVDLKRYLPRPGKDLRIFERCFIFDAIRPTSVQRSTTCNASLWKLP